MTNAKSIQISCVQMLWAKSIEFNLERTLHYIQTEAEYGSQVLSVPSSRLGQKYLEKLSFIITKQSFPSHFIPKQEFGNEGTLASQYHFSASA